MSFHRYALTCRHTDILTHSHVNNAQFKTLSQHNFFCVYTYSNTHKPRTKSWCRRIPSPPLTKQEISGENSCLQLMAHALSLSLSLSPSQTHTHTHGLVSLDVELVWFGSYSRDIMSSPFVPFGALFTQQWYHHGVHIVLTSSLWWRVWHIARWKFSIASLNWLRSHLRP